MLCPTGGRGMVIISVVSGVSPNTPRQMRSSGPGKATDSPVPSRRSSAVSASIA
jgi:hypothetical protein